MCVATTALHGPPSIVLALGGIQILYFAYFDGILSSVFVQPGQKQWE